LSPPPTETFNGYFSVVLSEPLFTGHHTFVTQLGQATHTSTNISICVCVYKKKPATNVATLGTATPVPTDAGLNPDNNG